MFCTEGEDFISAEVSFAQTPSYNVSAKGLKLQRFSSVLSAAEMERDMEDVGVSFAEGYLMVQFTVDEKISQMYLYLTEASWF